MDEGVIKEGKLQATGFDQAIREFDFRIEAERNEDTSNNVSVKYSFFVDKDEGHFELSVRDEEVWVRIVEIEHNHRAAVKAMGLPEALIDQAHFYFGKPIVSSSNLELHKVHPVTRKPINAFEAVFRTVAADKFWNRLVQTGKAKYVSHEDRYYFPADSHPISPSDP